MKQFFVIAIAFLLLASPLAGQQIYFENFDAEANGATTGTAVGGTWSTTYGGGGSFSKQSDLFHLRNVFRAVNLDGEGIWQTDAVATSGVVVIAIGYIATGSTVGAGDYLRFYYKVDGGVTETLFYELTGVANNVSARSPAITVTSSIQVIAKASNGETIDVLNADDRFLFDDVSINRVQTLYSRADNVNWNTSGTWSTVSHAGASCTCTPDEYSAVVIGDNDRINLSASADAYSVYITSTGTLRHTANNVVLNAWHGGGVTVEAGGSYTRNGQTGARLDLESEANYTISNAGSISLSDMQINAGTNITFAGGGTFGLTGDLDITDDASVTFSTSGAVTISTALDVVAGAPSTLTFNNSAAFSTPLLNIADASTINFNNSAAFNITNDFNIDADVTMNLNNAVAVEVTDALILNDTDGLTINGTGNMNVGGNLSLDDMLTKNGTGKLDIAGTISFSTGTAGAEGIDINAGEIEAGSILYNGDNSVITNGATLDVLGDVVAFDVDTDDNVITNEAGATLNFVNLDGFSGDGSGQGGDLVINNSGTINMSGNFIDIQAVGGGGAGCDLNNLATGVWNWALVPNNTYDITISTVLDLSESGNTFNYTGGTGTQQILPKTYHHLGLSGTDPGGFNVIKQFPALGSPATVNGNLLITEEAQLDINTNDKSLAIRGNFTMSGTNPDPFVDGDGFSDERVTFNGTSGDQTLTCPAAGETFQRLRVSKTSGNLILVNNLTIRNTSSTELDLNLGNIVTSATSLLILSDDVSYTGGSASSHVDGPLQKLGDDAFIFPVGDQGTFAPIEISAPGSSQTFTAEYINDPYTDLTVDNSLHHVSAYEYWSLTSTGGSSQVTLYWKNSDNSEITENLDLRIARYNGTDWTDIGNVSPPLGGTTGSIVSSSAETTFGLFTFGSEDNINPLPVTLLYFNAKVDGNVIANTWATSVEINNDFFTIEKSKDGETFQQVGIVRSKGNGKIEQHYSLLDEHPHFGRSYYRLKQTDYDGTVTYSPIRAVQYDGPVEASLKVYPNPNAGQPITLMLEGVKYSEPIPVEIFNQTGQKVFESTIKPDPSGTTVLKLPLNRQLSDGIYYLRVGQSYRLTGKLVIN